MRPWISDWWLNLNTLWSLFLLLAKIWPKVFFLDSSPGLRLNVSETSSLSCRNDWETKENSDRRENGRDWGRHQTFWVINDRSSSVLFLIEWTALLQISNWSSRQFPNRFPYVPFELPLKRFHVERFNSHSNYPPWQKTELNQVQS